MGTIVIRCDSFYKIEGCYVYRGLNLAKEIKKMVMI